MKSLLFKRIFQARKKRIMVYNKIRKVWESLTQEEITYIHVDDAIAAQVKLI